MPEKKNTEGKKYQLIKVAVELNLSKDHIVDFLKKKGIEVLKPLTFKFDQDVYDEIIKAFKKDKETVDKHKTKVQDFKKKYQESAEADKKKLESAAEKIEDQKNEEISFTVTDLRKEESPEAPKVDEVEGKSEEGQGPISEEKLETKAKTIDEEPSTLEVTSQGELVDTTQKEEIPTQADLFTEPSKEQLSDKQTIIDEAAEQVSTPQFEELEDGTKLPDHIGDIGETEVEKKELATEEKDNQAKTSLEKLRKNRQEIKIKGKVDLNKIDKPEPTPSEKTDSKSKHDDRKKVNDKVKSPKKLEPEIVVENKKDSAKTTKDKKPKKKKLRDEIKKKQEQDTENKNIKLKKVKGKEVDEKEVDVAIKRTFEEIDGVSSVRTAIKKKKKKVKLETIKLKHEEEEKLKSVLKVTEYMTVNDIAKSMNIGVGEVITKFLNMGLTVTINQRLDFEKIQIITDEFGYTVEKEEEINSDILADVDDKQENLIHRPPVVTIMGHVDHGKTSLLDRIRKSHIVAGESGGITQHIGAYQVTLPNGKQITFLDTPGHEAFTAMRARGAQVTDIVVLVVAADDSVMPQTIEAINHAKAAGVSIIVAINKIDKPGINLDRIYKELAEKGILVEKWGGKYQSSEISAKMGLNIDDLLEKIILEAELLDLKANPDRLARGVIIEVKLEKGKGTVATVLVRKGTLKIGDPFVAGVTSGRVRAMIDERDKKVTEVTPGKPIQILGFNDMPQAGDEIVVVESDKFAHEISVQRNQIKKAQDRSLVRHITLDDISRQIKIGGVKDLTLIVKGDVDGSVEALSDSLMKLSTPEVRVQVIHKGVGAIVESDVLLATTSNAIIIGFHVRPNVNARKLAETEAVEIRLYNIIYDVINEVRSAIEGMLAPEMSEEIASTVVVRDVYKISKIGTIAGCYVQSGKLMRNNKIRIYRNDMVIYDGKIETLKRFKEDVREVDSGYECGIKIENYNDIKTDDIIESYRIVEKKRKFDNVSKN